MKNKQLAELEKETVKNSQAEGIVVDDGYEEVPILNKFGKKVGEFYFNPTDIGIIERFNSAVKRLDEITEPITKADEGDDSETIEGMGEAKEKLFEICNYIFGGNMTEAFFGNVNPFSPIGGDFYFVHCLNALGKYISMRFDKEVKRVNKNISKYTKNIKK